MFNFDGELKDSATKILIAKTGNVSEIMIPASLGFKYQIKKFDDDLVNFYFPLKENSTRLPNYGLTEEEIKIVEGTN